MDDLGRDLDRSGTQGDVLGRDAELRAERAGQFGCRNARVAVDGGQAVLDAVQHRWQRRMRRLVGRKFRGSSGCGLALLVSGHILQGGALVKGHEVPL